MDSDEKIGNSDNDANEKNSMLTTKSIKSYQNVSEIDKCIEISEETSCGIWFIKSAWLQRFANKKAYVFLYGVLGCIYSATYAYFNGTITTLEKRFKIPSRTTGIKIPFLEI